MEFNLILVKDLLCWIGIGDGLCLFLLFLFEVYYVVVGYLVSDIGVFEVLFSY